MGRLRLRQGGYGHGITMLIVEAVGIGGGGRVEGLGGGRKVKRNGGHRRLQASRPGPIPRRSHDGMKFHGFGSVP